MTAPGHRIGPGARHRLRRVVLSAEAFEWTGNRGFFAGVRIHGTV